MQGDFDQEKAKNDNLGLELINLVNENKSLSNDANAVSRKHGDVAEEQRRLMRKVEKLESELQDKREAVVVAQGEIERLKSELVRADLKGQQSELDMQNKRQEMEREFIELSKKNMLDETNVKRDDMSAH